MDMKWLSNVEYVISRPDLYDLLFNSVPRDRICLGKRVLSFTQNEDGVMVRCSDNSTYHADILVGADGAYSAVRQILYKELKVGNKLPSSDDVPLPFNCVCLVGQTEVLDPEEFPDLKEKNCQFYSVLGQSTMCSWLTFTTAQNTVCWMVIHFLDKESAKRNDSFRNSEWGPEAAEALARENMLASVIRSMIKRLPPWLWRKIVLRQVQARHQASFLPLIEDPSKVKAQYQRSLHKTLPILKDLAENPRILGTASSPPVTV
ncbi:hypothetical protein BGZ82_002273 [Podila clonocystis]|nr:hypothetical protein BGZ82_002273 [Podila clonocystis]